MAHPGTMHSSPPAQSPERQHQQQRPLTPPKRTASASPSSASHAHFPPIRRDMSDSSSDAKNMSASATRNASNKRPLSTISTDSNQGPTRKQTKWTPQEDERIIQLRGSGMKWENISKQFPGRSAIACRLHYQNFLERKPAWDEEKKNKLARLYERFKQSMWEPVAKELQMPWRAAEAMHWTLGSEGMASRAGTTPFSSNPATSRPPGAPGLPEMYSSESYHSIPGNYPGSPPHMAHGIPPPSQSAAYPPMSRPPVPGTALSSISPPSIPPPSYASHGPWPGTPAPTHQALVESQHRISPPQRAPPRDYIPSSSYFMARQDRPPPPPPSSSLLQSYTSSAPAARASEHETRRMEYLPPPPQHSASQYPGPFLQPPLPNVPKSSFGAVGTSPRLPPIRTREESETERRDREALYGDTRPGTSGRRSPPPYYRRDSEERRDQ